MKVSDYNVMTVEEYINKHDLDMEEFTSFQKPENVKKILESLLIEVMMEYKNTKSNNRYIVMDGYKIFAPNDNEALVTNTLLLTMKNPKLDTGLAPGFILNPNGDSVELSVPMTYGVYTDGYIPYTPDNWPKNLLLTKYPEKKYVELDLEGLGQN